MLPCYFKAAPPHPCFWCAVHRLISEQDWETLRPMVSSKLLDALKS